MPLYIEFDSHLAHTGIPHFIVVMGFIFVTFCIMLSINSTLLLNAAWCKHVLPSVSLASILAPIFIKYSQISLFPFIDAICRGVNSSNCNKKKVYVFYGLKYFIQVQVSQQVNLVRKN